jgi:phosphoglucosamine mutase
MNRLYFGTDGVRGKVGGPTINPAFASRLAYAAGRWAGGSGRALIGRDPRASGLELERAVAAGLRAAGLEPVSLGVAPTPAVARAVRVARAALGVVITASHNPASDNGFKFFKSDGSKLSDKEEARVEELLPVEPFSPAELGATQDGAADYIAAVLAMLPPGVLRGWPIVLDTANGATCATSPAVLRALGAQLTTLGDAPDGTNINAGVGSEHPEKLAAQVVAMGARLGVAHDGDGDRCVLCDERGAILDGDDLLTLLAIHALGQGKLAAKTLVVTVQSNLGVDAAVAAVGGRVLRTPVGDRHVAERMRTVGATLGGESSGHIICADVSPTGDGLVAALRVMAVMRETGQPLSALRHGLRRFPQATVNLRVREKRPLVELRRLAPAIRALEAGLGDRGRVLARFSGTEDKLRLLVEGPDEATVAAGLAALVAAACEDLAVIEGASQFLAGSKGGA